MNREREATELLREARDALWHKACQPRDCIGCRLEERIDAFLAASDSAKPAQGAER